MTMYDAKGGFDPNQPRVPAGSPQGGQWTSGGGGGGGVRGLGPLEEVTPEMREEWGAQAAEMAAANKSAVFSELDRRFTDFDDPTAWGNKNAVVNRISESTGLSKAAVSRYMVQWSAAREKLGEGSPTRYGKFTPTPVDSAFELYDAVEVTHPTVTRDGFLVAEARVARTGIQLYRARELGLDGDPDRVIRVYRPPEEVFSADAMRSYAYRPVTVEHNGMIDSRNWREHARGQTGGDVVRDGEFVRVPLVLMDSAAIEEWKQGRRELSMGYTMDLDVQDGTTPNGEAYDAIQRNLRMNHLALVSRARGGSMLRLGDQEPEDNSMDVKLTTITVDGLQVQTTDAGAQAISKLNKDLADARKAKDDAAAQHAQDLAAKDKELATKDAEIEDLKGKVLSDADLDRKVKDRADLIAVARSIADQDYSGKSDADIRKAAVSAKLGRDAVADKSPEYIQARFDILAEDANKDPVRRVLQGSPQPVGDGVDQAHAGYVGYLNDAWKGAGKEVQ